jgi:putative Mn2+ efflux pump MntP
MVTGPLFVILFFFGLFYIFTSMDNRADKKANKKKEAYDDMVDEPIILKDRI